MSSECGECERDLRGGHDVECSRWQVFELTTRDWGEEGSPVQVVVVEQAEFEEIRRRLRDARWSVKGHEAKCVAMAAERDMWRKRASGPIPWCIRCEKSAGDCSCDHPHHVEKTPMSKVEAGLRQEIERLSADVDKWHKRADEARVEAVNIMAPQWAGEREKLETENARLCRRVALADVLAATIRLFYGNTLKRVVQKDLDEYMDSALDGMVFRPSTIHLCTVVREGDGQVAACCGKTAAELGSGHTFTHLPDIVSCPEYQRGT